MKRFDIYLDPNVVKQFGDLSGTVSEHIRHAMVEYLKRIQNENVSASASKNRGEVNG